MLLYFNNVFAFAMPASQLAVTANGHCVCCRRFVLLNACKDHKPNHFALPRPSEVEAVKHCPGI